MSDVSRHLVLQTGPGFPRINGYRRIDLDVRKVTFPKVRNIKRKMEMKWLYASSRVLQLLSYK